MPYDEEMRVVAALIEKEDRLLIARRMEGSFMAGFWEFPGGKVEEGEKPEEALRREIKEELDVDIEVLELFHTNNHVYEIKGRKRLVRLLTYKAKMISGEIKCLGCDEYRWVLPEELSGFVFVDADVPVVNKLSVF